MVDEAEKCPSYQKLVWAILNSESEWPLEVRHYDRFKEDLSVVEGVVVYQGRSMVPVSLREEVLATLHSGHQGVTNKWGRAVSSVWWPAL